MNAEAQRRRERPDVFTRRYGSEREEIKVYSLTSLNLPVIEFFSASPRLCV
jgi:hypothetical protein